MKCNPDKIYSAFELLFQKVLSSEDTPENMAQACADEHQQSYYVSMFCEAFPADVAPHCLFRVEAGAAPRGSKTYFPKN